MTSGFSPITHYKLVDFGKPHTKAHPTHLAVGQLPSSVDLRSGCPDVYDQGQIGSCTANALAGDIEFVKMKQGQNQTGTPSRLDLYEQERQAEGSFPDDSGAFLPDGINAAKTNGICPETDWTYSPDNLNIQPTPQALADRKDNKIVQALNIDHTDLNQLKQSLADGYPVTLAINVYQSFESPDNLHTGVINMPQSGEKILGGHAMLLVGYDDASQRFIFRNSWKLKDGTPWGDKGYGTIPYQYIASTDLAYPDEFWSVRQVDTGAAAPPKA
jgi:C1A family cysteine protease